VLFIVCIFVCIIEHKIKLKTQTRIYNNNVSLITQYSHNSSPHTNHMNVDLVVMEMKVWMGLVRFYFIITDELHEIEIQLPNTRIADEYHIVVTTPVSNVPHAVLSIAETVNRTLCQI